MREIWLEEVNKQTEKSDKQNEQKETRKKTFARGTTDPAIDSVTWIKHGTTYISWKFGH